MLKIGTRQRIRLLFLSLYLCSFICVCVCGVRLRIRIDMQTNAHRMKSINATRTMETECESLVCACIRNYARFGLNAIKRWTSDKHNISKSHKRFVNHRKTKLLCELWASDVYYFSFFFFNFFMFWAEQFLLKNSWIWTGGVSIYGWNGTTVLYEWCTDLLLFWIEECSHQNSINTPDRTWQTHEFEWNFETNESGKRENMFFIGFIFSFPLLRRFVLHLKHISEANCFLLFRFNLKYLKFLSLEQYIFGWRTLSLILLLILYFIL